MIVGVQHTFLLGNLQGVLWCDLLPTTQFVDGGVNNNIIDGLLPGAVPHRVPPPSRQLPLGRGGQENIKEGTVLVVFP